MAQEHEERQGKLGLSVACTEDLLDAAALSHLKSLDPGASSTGFFVTIIETFIHDTDNLFQKTNHLDCAVDHDSIRKAAHYLKSSAASVGAKKLSTLCGKLETSILKGESIDVKQHFAEIQSVYYKTREALYLVLEVSK